MSTLRITPIGTCRIHTPLKRATLRYPIEVDLRRNYGFVHTSSEALQLVQFLQGEKSFDPRVAPLVFRDADPGTFEAEHWHSADLHVVEISSAKRVTVGADEVQSNYLQRHFSDFFANRQRSRDFWRLVKMGHRQDLLAFLEAQPSFQMLAPGDRELLANLSMEQQSFKSIKSDMAEIIDRLGRDSVLFVTHVNAVTPDESVIPSRDRLIRWVKLAADQLEAAVFDPTPVLEEFGQEQALEQGGLDLTHYTLAFSDRLYDVIHQSHVGTLISAPSEVGTSEDDRRNLGMLAAHLEAMLDLGDFFVASREIHAALETAPDSIPLIRLRGLIRSRIGDFAGALADLTAQSDESLLSQSMRVALLDALSHTGEADAALSVARSLFADEIESAAIYRAAGLAAEKSGKAHLAIRYSKQAFRMDRSDLSSALHALVLLAQAENEAEAAEWRRELLDNLGSFARGAFEIASWALANHDQELFSAAWAAGSLLDKAGSIDLLEDAFNADMMRSLADSIPALARLGKLPPALAGRRAALLNNALDAIGPLTESGRAAEAYDLARAVARLTDIPTSQVAGARLAGQARRFIPRITRHVRAKVRAAFGAGNLNEVVRIADASGDVLIGDPDTAVIAGRSLFDTGRSDDALTLLKATLAENPDSDNARRWTGRYAAKMDDYATALEAYSGLTNLDSPQSEAVRAEAERFLATAERRALKKLREYSDSEKHDDALTLAAAITKYLGPLERTERELARMHRSLRLRLKEVDQGEAELEEREPILRKLIRIRPDDQPSLRRLALELMRQFRFAEAAAIWERLHLLDPSNESADRNRVRCATLAQRRASVSATDVDEAA